MADLDNTRIRQQSRKHCAALAARQVTFADHNVIHVEFGAKAQAQRHLSQMSDAEMMASVRGGYGSLENVPGWDSLESEAPAGWHTLENRR